jgi:SAM-dependent methyltransferase
VSDRGLESHHDAGVPAGHEPKRPRRRRIAVWGIAAKLAIVAIILILPSGSAISTAFRALADAGAIRDRVLDVGCGTGEHVHMCAALGLDATGVDYASAALHAAEGNARDRALTARFLLRDARKLADLGESFDTALDSGLFYIFGEKDRAAYIDSVRSVLVHGRCLMLCFSDQQPGDQGPAAGDAGRDHHLIGQGMADRLNRTHHTGQPHRPGRPPGLADRPHQNLSAQVPERTTNADR